MIIAKLEKTLKKVNTSQLALFAVLLVTLITGGITIKNEYFSSLSWYEGTWYLDSDKSYQSINDEIKKQISELKLNQDIVELFFKGHPESSKLIRGLQIYRGNPKKRWDLIFNNISLTVNFGNDYGFFETNLPHLDHVTVESSLNARTYRHKMFDFNIERILRNGNEEIVLKPELKRVIKTVNRDGRAVEQEKKFQKSTAYKHGDYLIINMPIVSFSEVSGANSKDRVIRGNLYFQKS